MHDSKIFHSFDSKREKMRKNRLSMPLTKDSKQKKPSCFLTIRSLLYEGISVLLYTTRNCNIYRIKHWETSLTLSSAYISFLVLSIRPPWLTSFEWSCQKRSRVATDLFRRCTDRQRPSPKISRKSRCLPCAHGHPKEAIVLLDFCILTSPHPPPQKKGAIRKIQIRSSEKAHVELCHFDVIHLPPSRSFSNLRMNVKDSGWNQRYRYLTPHQGLHPLLIFEQCRGFFNVPRTIRNKCFVTGPMVYRPYLIEMTRKSYRCRCHYKGSTHLSAGKAGVWTRRDHPARYGPVLYQCNWALNRLVMVKQGKREYI